MKNELQNITSANRLTATVNQTGEKNIHIDHAENVTQNVVLNFQYIGRTSNGTMKPTTRAINTDFYNLFVIGAETFKQNHFVIAPDRAVSGHWTSEDIRDKYASLTDTAIHEIKTFPTLFMPEADNYNAVDDAEQQVIFGFVDNVRVQDNGVNIECQYLWSIPMQQISDIGFDLGMKDMNTAITEMNHTHWAIKHTNLIKKLKDAGISLLGGAL